VARLVKGKVMVLVSKGKEAHPCAPSDDLEPYLFGVESLRPFKVADFEDGVPPTDRTDLFASGHLLRKPPIIGAV
jgi:hypothetical protein